MPILWSALIACTAPPRQEALIGDPALFVRSVGRGRPLVVVHGGPGSSHDHLEVIEAMAPEGYRIVTYDQRGVGRSAPLGPDRWLDLDAHVRDLDRIRYWAGTAQIDVLGHSWGGIVAAAYAAAHPDRVRSLVLVGSGGLTKADHLRGAEALQARRAALEASGALPSAPPQRLDPSCRHVWRQLAASYADPSALGRSEAPLSSCHPELNYRTWRAVGGYDLIEPLAAATMPALVLYGRQDPQSINAARIAGALPGAQAPTWLEACGHQPMHECPEAFASALARFYGALGP